MDESFNEDILVTADGIQQDEDDILVCDTCINALSIFNVRY